MHILSCGVQTSSRTQYNVMHCTSYVTGRKLLTRSCNSSRLQSRGVYSTMPHSLIPSSPQFLETAEAQQRRTYPKGHHLQSLCTHPPQPSRLWCLHYRLHRSSPPTNKRPPPLAAAKTKDIIPINSCLPRHLRLQRLRP